MENKTERQYDLIIAIVNKGTTDLVMNAARKAGSTGGTITVARGTGNPEIAQFYGLAIQPEKEMVFIVVDRTIEEKVMKAIYDEAGLGSKGQGILFTLPIEDAVGLDPIAEMEEKEKEEGDKASS